jgi:hypothetical protein
MRGRIEQGRGSGMGRPTRVRYCRVYSAWLRSEARFELPSSARLRRFFCMRWVVRRSPEPTYQTTKQEKILYEMRFSEMNQPTKQNMRDDKSRSWMDGACPRSRWRVSDHGAHRSHAPTSHQIMALSPDSRAWLLMRELSAQAHIPPRQRAYIQFRIPIVNPSWLHHSHP